MTSVLQRGARLQPPSRAGAVQVCRRLAAPAATMWPLAVAQRLPTCARLVRLRVAGRASRRAGRPCTTNHVVRPARPTCAPLARSPAGGWLRGGPLRVVRIVSYGPPRSYPHSSVPHTPGNHRRRLLKRLASLKHAQDTARTYLLPFFRQDGIASVSTTPGSWPFGGGVDGAIVHVAFDTTLVRHDTYRPALLSCCVVRLPYSIAPGGDGAAGAALGCDSQARVRVPTRLRSHIHTHSRHSPPPLRAPLLCDDPRYSRGTQLATQFHPPPPRVPPGPLQRFAAGVAGDAGPLRVHCPVGWVARLCRGASALSRVACRRCACQHPLC